MTVVPTSVRVKMRNTVRKVLHSGPLNQVFQHTPWICGHISTYRTWYRDNILYFCQPQHWSLVASNFYSIHYQPYFYYFYPKIWRSLEEPGYYGQEIELRDGQFNHEFVSSYPILWMGTQVVCFTCSTLRVVSWLARINYWFVRHVTNCRGWALVSISAYK